MVRAANSTWAVWATVVGVTVLGTACESSPPTDSAGIADVPLRITAITVGTPTKTLVVEVTAADLPTALVFNLTVVNAVATGTIRIPPGQARTIHVSAVDDQGEVTHEGSVTIDVRPGQNPPVQVTLRPQSGHVPITVTFGNYTVLVAPAAVTIDASVTARAQLMVKVIDVDGNDVPIPEVGWATSQPAVAMVDGVGLVTGVADGSATIVATFEGVAGLSAVTVQGFGGPPPQGSSPMDYYAAFPANLDLTQTAALMVSVAGKPGVGGTVTVPGLGFSATFTTDATGLATVTLPSAVMLDASDKVEARGVIVHADDSVAVLAINDKPFSMTPAELLPASALGVQHFVMSAGAGFHEGSFLALVATVDATTVSITPTSTAGARAAGTPFQVTLNRGDAYQLIANGINGDLTGTAVQSDKPIGVFGGHIFAQVPAGSCCPGILWAAIPPAPAVTGTDFLAFPLRTRTGYWLRVLGLQPNTFLTASGIVGLSSTLRAGEYTEARTTSAARVVSNHPILVAQLAEGLEADGLNQDRTPLNPGVDPCMTLLQPVSGLANRYVFDTPIDQVVTRYANIVAPAAAVGSLTVNGTSIPVGSFTAIGGSGYSGAAVPLSAGVNQIISSGAVFGVVVYGWDAGSGSNGFCFSPHASF